MSASNNNNNNRFASFELIEFNRNPPQALQPKNENKEAFKPREDYTGFNHTGFNHTEFVSWSKSHTLKPFNNNVERHQRADNEWFDYAAFITLVKSQIVQN